ENEDHRDVDHHHDAHQHIGQVPHQINAQAGAHKDQQHGHDAEHHHKLLGGDLLHQIGQGVIHIVQVADEGGEGEENHSHRDKDGAHAAEHSGQGGLHIGGALGGFGGLHAGAQEHQSGGGADEQGVQEDGQH